MTREEIEERMIKGAEYLERDDLTPEQREKAKKRYDELEADLLKLDVEEREKAERRRNVSPEIQAEMDKIRAILLASGAKPRKKSG